MCGWVGVRGWVWGGGNVIALDTRFFKSTRCSHNSVCWLLAGAAEEEGRNTSAGQPDTRADLLV